MISVLLHAADGTAVELGSPLYRMLPGHLAGLLAVVLVPAAALLVKRRAEKGGEEARRLMAGYRQLPAHERFAAWLLLVSAAVHLGLVFGGGHTVLGVLFALDAAALLVVVRRLLLGLRWRLPAGLLLTGSILAYAVTVMAAEQPDQVGLATKLVELAALGVVLMPLRPGRLRRLAGSGALVSLVVATGLAAWIGAFAAAERGGDGHHGPVPEPGTLVHQSPERKPTKGERAAADRFFARASAALRKYRRVEVAAADGYRVDGIVGSDFHAGNERFGADGLVANPERPESLVYARTSHRKVVLLGAVYEMPGIGDRGPAFGGPLTQWHGHENVCISLVPFALSGLVSPFGGCATGSIAIPVTNEMIHLWVVPGAPTRFGDLDETWRAAYLRRLDAA